VDLKPEMFVCFVVWGSLYVCGYVSNLQALQGTFLERTPFLQQSYCLPTSPAHQGTKMTVKHRIQHKHLLTRKF